MAEDLTIIPGWAWAVMLSLVGALGTVIGILWRSLRSSDAQALHSELKASREASEALRQDIRDLRSELHSQRDGHDALRDRVSRLEVRVDNLERGAA